MIESVNMHAAKTNLSRLVDRAAAGEEIVIAKNGKPVAKLVAYAPEQELRPLGGMEGQIWMADDFDDEMPEDWLRLFYGEDEEDEPAARHERPDMVADQQSPAYRTGPSSDPNAGQ